LSQVAARLKVTRPSDSAGYPGAITLAGLMKTRLPLTKLPALRVGGNELSGSALIGRRQDAPLNSAPFSIVLSVGH
jgi:hypothetical protein